MFPTAMPANAVATPAVAVLNDPNLPYRPPPPDPLQQMVGHVQPPNPQQVEWSQQQQQLVFQRHQQALMQAQNRQLANRIAPQAAAAGVPTRNKMNKPRIILKSGMST